MPSSLAADVHGALDLPEVFVRLLLNNATGTEPSHDAQALFLNGFGFPPPEVQRGAMGLAEKLGHLLTAALYFKLLINFSALFLGPQGRRVLYKAYGVELRRFAAASSTETATGDKRKRGSSETRDEEASSKKSKHGHASQSQVASSSTQETSAIVSSTQPAPQEAPLSPPTSLAVGSPAAARGDLKSVAPAQADPTPPVSADVSIELEEGEEDGLYEMRLAAEDLGAPWLSRLFSTALLGAADPKHRVAELLAAASQHRDALFSERAKGQMEEESESESESEGDPSGLHQATDDLVQIYSAILASTST